MNITKQGIKESLCLVWLFGIIILFNYFDWVYGWNRIGMAIIACIPFIMIMFGRIAPYNRLNPDYKLPDGYYFEEEDEAGFEGVV